MKINLERGFRRLTCVVSALGWLTIIFFLLTYCLLWAKYTYQMKRNVKAAEDLMKRKGAQQSEPWEKYKKDNKSDGLTAEEEGELRLSSLVYELEFEKEKTLLKDFNEASNDLWPRVTAGLWLICVPWVTFFLLRWVIQGFGLKD